MTKKDYELIAECVNSTKGKFYPSINDCIAEIVIKLCLSLRAENPRFDSRKFIKACGFTDKDTIIG